MNGNIRFCLYEVSRISKSIQTESKLVVDRGWEEAKNANGCGVSLKGYKNVLKVDSGDGCTIL